jgi:TolA-binding protein
MNTTPIKSVKPVKSAVVVRNYQLPPVAKVVPSQPRSVASKALTPAERLEAEIQDMQKDLRKAQLEAEIIDMQNALLTAHKEQQLRQQQSVASKAPSVASRSARVPRGAKSVASKSPSVASRQKPVSGQSVRVPRRPKSVANKSSSVSIRQKPVSGQSVQVPKRPKSVANKSPSVANKSWSRPRKRRPATKEPAPPVPTVITLVDEVKAPLKVATQPTPFDRQPSQKTVADKSHACIIM